MTDYTYDKDGRMVTLANRIPKSFTWTYDDNTRTVTTKTPRQQPGQAAASQSSVAVLNPRGLPASATEPSGQTTTFTSYDDEGRLLTRTDGVGTTVFTYWPNGLPKETIENGRTSYRGYDALNRLIEYRDGEGNTLRYDYHPSGELKEITYPDGVKKVGYTYDDFGRLWKVTDWAGRVTSYTYDDASRLTRLDRPNGTHREQEYDAAGQLRFVKEFKSDGSYLAYQELRYDDDGRIVWRFLHPAPAPVTLVADTLLYDDDNRLSSWNSSGVTFDADGNMTNGPLPSGTFGTYGYDARNRLTSAAGSGYRYTAEGARVQVTGTDAAAYVVDPNAALSRTLVRVKGGVTTYYVYGLGLLYEETAGATKTYHYDHLGSTLALTTDGLTVTDRWSYAPFGAVTSRTGSTDTPFQLHGEMGVMTDSSGLVCMRARYYNPRLMRFVNADPIGFDGGLNHYAFCGNNPIGFVDPQGLERRSSATPQAGWGIISYQDGDGNWHDLAGSSAAPTAVGVGGVLELAGLVRDNYNGFVRQFVTESGGYSPTRSAIREYFNRPGTSTAVSRGVALMYRWEQETFTYLPESSGQNSPQSTSALMNRAGAIAKWGGRGLIVTGTAISIYDIATADEPYFVAARESSAIVVGYGGATAGAWAGAGIGSFFPGPGTAIGAVVGGAAGAFGGAKAGQAMGGGAYRAINGRNP